MKILFRLSFLVLIPIIVGFALALSGYRAGVWILALGTPAVMIILVIVGLVMMMKGKLFGQNSEVSGENPVEPTEKEKEQAALEEINSSHLYKSQFNLAEYEANHIIEGTKSASKKGMAAVIIIVILVLADVVLATVFAIKHIWVGAIVCAALFALTVITGLITAIIAEKTSMKGDVSKAEKMICGKVKSCVLSSMGTTKSVTPTVRINSVVYRVVVSADCDEYVAYSSQFYETDEKVVIAVMGKKRAKVVEEADLENQSEEIKNNYYDCLNNGESVLIKKNYAKPSKRVRTVHVRSHRRRR